MPFYVLTISDKPPMRASVERLTAPTLLVTCACSTVQTFETGPGLSFPNVNITSLCIAKKILYPLSVLILWAISHSMLINSHFPVITFYSDVKICT